MKNNAVTDFVRDYCSPKDKEKDFAKNEYDFLAKTLEGKIFQSGSYARATAITPLNDLDVFWVISQEIKKAISSDQLSITNILSDLSSRLSKEYLSVKRNVKITPQAHSVMIEFLSNDHEFTLDIIPAVEIEEANEFGMNYYRIPEVGLMSKSARRKFYESYDETSKFDWIKTDPKGYREVAKLTNEKTRTFREISKILKRWKRAWKNKKNFNTEFKLKSFHLELIAQNLANENPNLSTIEILFTIFDNFEKYINTPQFLDRAQENNDSPRRFVDSYIADLNEDEKRIILIASLSVRILIKGILDDEEKVVTYLHRLTNGEEFISTYGFEYSEVLKDPSLFSVDGNIRRRDGLVSGWLRKSLPLQKGLTRGIKSREIDFAVTKNMIGDLVPYWKVRNTGNDALAVNQLRGEISRGGTLNSPEKTSFRGLHYVTCYLVNETTKEVISENTVPVKIV